MIDIPLKPVTNRDEQGRFGAGNNANPNGRPRGKTLKDFAREYLMALSPEDKLDYLSKVSPDIVWRMAEGNPTEDRNVKISVPQPILGGSSQALTVEASVLLENTATSSSQAPQDENMPSQEGLDTLPK